ncbi:hypothetical protein HZC34_07145 [Candidatus Saganbacteria bacterium]|nr:hypothetical protein [Candidatus Saganbacteria bacterium]
MNILKNLLNQAFFKYSLFFFVFILLCGYIAGCGLGIIDDTRAPAFNGIVTASTSSTYEVVVTWNSATDDASAASKVNYLVFKASSSSEMSSYFLSKSFDKMVTGVTSTTVSSLTPNTAYYFAVRSSDEAGNIDTNTTTKVATTYANVPSTFTLLPSGTTNDMYGVTFVTVGSSFSGHGWAVGKAGTIIHSTNSGETWAAQTSSTTKELHVVYAVSSVEALALGLDRAYVTLEVNVWRASTAFNFDMRSFSYNISNAGKYDFSVGTDGVLRKSLNSLSLSSKTFEAISTTGFSGIRACDFYDDAHGVIVGENGLVAATSNTGESWTTLANIPTAKNLNGVYYRRVLTTLYFIISGDQGFIAKSVDNGSNWTVLSSNFPTDFHGIAIISISPYTFISSGSGGKMYKFTY